MSNFISLTEVYEGSGAERFTRLSDEAISQSRATKYFLRPIIVGVEHICCLREDEIMREKLQEGDLPEGLSPKQAFTKVHLGQSGGHVSSCVTVVGHLEAIASKVYKITTRA